MKILNESLYFFLMHKIQPEKIFLFTHKHTPINKLRPEASVDHLRTSHTYAFDFCSSRFWFAHHLWFEAEPDH